MSDKRVVISIFESEPAADAAVVVLKDRGVAKHDAIGILVLDENGKVKAHKVGSHSFYKGAGIGLVLGLLGPVGVGLGMGVGMGATTGGVLGIAAPQGPRARRRRPRTHQCGAVEGQGRGRRLGCMGRGRCDRRDAHRSRRRVGGSRRQRRGPRGRRGCRGNPAGERLIQLRRRGYGLNLAKTPSSNGVGSISRLPEKA
jgi:hypothetical protein